MKMSQARTENFNNRIQAGTQDGSINRSEHRQLAQARKGVAAQAQEFKGNDGKIDKAEAAQLRAQRDQLSGTIADFRHN